MRRGGMRATGRAARAGALALAVLLASPAPALEVIDPGQGPVPLPAAATGARELSGVAWAGGDRYLAVSDDEPALYTLAITVDRTSGRIRAAAVTARTPLDQGVDLEGVAYAGDGTVYVSDEDGPAIRRHMVATGASRGAVAVPERFATARRNLSLESLALAPDGRALWTANEEALKGDGPTNQASDGGGTLVRLQRLRADAGGPWRPAGQWTYRVDGMEPFLGRGPSGVVDLAVLPDGTLLVLERAAGVTGLAGDPPSAQVGLRSRIYAVDLRGATDTSRLPRLDGTVAAARKHLLWEGVFPRHNFEGMALGPPLENGDRSLVLIADDGNGLDQGLYALRLGPSL